MADLVSGAIRRGRDALGTARGADHLIGALPFHRDQPGGATSGSAAFRIAADETARTRRLPETAMAVGALRPPDASPVAPVNTASLTSLHEFEAAALSRFLEIGLAQAVAAPTHADGWKVLLIVIQKAQSSFGPLPIGIFEALECSRHASFEKDFTEAYDILRIAVKTVAEQPAEFAGSRAGAARALLELGVVTQSATSSFGKGVHLMRVFLGRLIVSGLLEPFQKVSLETALEVAGSASSTESARRTLSAALTMPLN